MELKVGDVTVPIHVTRYFTMAILRMSHVPSAHINSISTFELLTGTVQLCSNAQP
jgi:hypothetical protein